MSFIQSKKHMKHPRYDQEPTFNFWVSHVLMKHERTISLVLEMHKFGIEMPKNIKETYSLDQSNGNTIEADAIQKEMDPVRIAFQDWAINLL